VKKEDVDSDKEEENSNSDEKVTKKISRPKTSEGGRRVWKVY